MYGYKIKINSLPKLLWACETTVNDYVWENRNRKDALEISFSKFNTKTVISEGKTYMLKNSALSCIVADEKIESFCEPGSPITIVSVAVSIINLEYTCCNITEADCEDASYLLIPLFIEQLLNIRMKHAEKLLLDQNIPTAKVASLCGFCDETYFRKKFKQYFGMNVREYRQIKNSLTLYHPKPQKGTNPSHPF